MLFFYRPQSSPIAQHPELNYNQMAQEIGPIPQNGILLSHILQSLGLEIPNHLSPFGIPTPPLMRPEVNFIRTVPPTMPKFKSETKLTIPPQTQTVIKDTGTSMLTQVKQKTKSTGISPTVPPQIKTETMFLTTMHRLGLQVCLQSDKASIDATGTVASTANSTKGSDTVVVTANQPKRAKREVILPTFKTKRLELIRNNKPHYSYEPKILKIWQKSDYLKHNNLYKENGKQEIIMLQVKIAFYIYLYIAFWVGYLPN